MGLLETGKATLFVSPKAQLSMDATEKIKTKLETIFDSEFNVVVFDQEVDLRMIDDNRLAMSVEALTQSIQVLSVLITDYLDERGLEDPEDNDGKNAAQYLDEDSKQGAHL